MVNKLINRAFSKEHFLAPNFHKFNCSEKHKTFIALYRRKKNIPNIV